MMQTSSRHSVPPLSVAQIADIARTLDAMCPVPPREYRIHPDDWDEVRRTIAPAPIGHQPSSFTGLRIVLDVDAPRLVLKGGQK